MICRTALVCRVTLKLSEIRFNMPTKPRKTESLTSKLLKMLDSESINALLVLPSTKYQFHRREKLKKMGKLKVLQIQS